MSYAAYPFGSTPFAGTRRRSVSLPIPEEPSTTAAALVDIVVEVSGAPVMDDWEYQPTHAHRPRRTHPDRTMAFFAPNHKPPAFQSIFW